MSKIFGAANANNGAANANNGFPRFLEYQAYRNQISLEQQMDSIIAKSTPASTVRSNSTVAPEGTGVIRIRIPKNLYLSLSRYDFFIAYARPDWRKAQELSRLLKRHWRKVFLDADLRLGDIWPRVLPNAMEASRVIVVLVSRHSYDALYLQSEITKAIQLVRDKPRSHTVIPVILENLPWGMPYGLNIFQALDATTWSGLHVADALVNCLTSLMPSSDNHGLSLPASGQRAY